MNKKKCMDAVSKEGTGKNEAKTILEEMMVKKIFKVRNNIYPQT